MQKLKKWVSLLLVMVMCLGTVQTSAFALGGDTAYEGDHDCSITVFAQDDGVNPTNDYLPGVGIQLEDITAGRYHNHGTKTVQDASGVTWTGLSAGLYRVTQVATPSTHVENNQTEIIVLKSNTQDKHFETTFKSQVRGSLIVYRMDTNGNLVGGGLVKVVDARTNGNIYSKTVSVANDGSVVFSGLPEGEYIVSEVRAPANESILTVAQHVTVRGGGMPVTVLLNDAPWAHVTVLLLDDVTGAPIPKAPFSVTEVGGNIVDQGYTTSNGTWSSKKLEAGTYILQQTGTVTGYQDKLPSWTFTITTDGESQITTLYNTPLGSITIVAYDSITHQLLPGATITLMDSKNEIVKGPGITNPQTAGVDGTAIFKNIPDGHYTATIVGPDGHVMDTANININVTGGSNEYINITGTEKGSILIRCLTEDGKPLASASFRISRMNGDYIGDVTTGADGTVTMGDLESGQYLVEQTKVPNGYVAESATKTVIVSPGKIAEAQFINRTKPFITVETMVKGTRIPIEGSVVTLVNEKGQEIRRGSTDVNGQVIFQDLEPGTYTVKYTSCPDGYTVEVASQTVVVERYKSGYALLTATKHSAILIEKRDSQTQEPLSGAMFQVRNKQGVPVALVTTDKSGFASTEALPAGRYTIRELYAPDKYMPQTELREVTVENNTARHEIFTNTKFSGIVIYAYDKLGNPLANVPYIVYQVDKQGISTEVAHVTTNNSGIATTQELAPGRYMVTETTIPENYTLVNPTESHIELFAGETNYVRFVHVMKSTILMQTYDRYTNAPIPGATYEITSADSSFKANYTADQNGEIQTELLEQGTYYVRQLTVPEGYLLNTTTQTIQVLRDQLNLARFENTPISRIQIQSVIAGSNFGLEECSYTVEDSTGKEVFHGTTDATGLLTTGELKPGNYTVKEIAVKDGYSIVQSSRTVQVTTGIPTSVKFEHIAYTSIIISLTDFEDSTKGLANSKFIIETLGGQYVTDVVTDSAGRAETELLPADTYVIRQETAPEGYLLDTTYQWVNLTTNSCSRVEFTNKHVSGLIIESFMLNSHTPVAGAQFEIAHENGKIVKTVTVDSTGVMQITDLEPDTYVIKEVSTPAGYTPTTMSQKVTVTFGASTTATFYHTGKSALTIRLTDAISAAPLAGGIFRVTNSRGDVIMNDAMTDKDGQITIPIMEAGKYTVNQIKAPDGYSIDTNPVVVEVKDEQTAYANVTNHKNVGLTIEAVDTKGNHLDGASFEVRNSDNIVVATESVDASGTTFVENLKAGKYTVKEIIVPDGWTSRTLTQTVTVGKDGNATVKFVHTNKSALVIKLIDAQTKAPIAGGQFELRDAKGDVVMANLITDLSGNITVPSLDAGRYTVVQVKTAEGYSIDKTVMTVDIKDDKTFELTVTNHKNKGLTIEVLNDANEHLGGAAFEIRDADNVLVGSYTADDTGVIRVTDLKAGKYTVKEITVPSGWTARTLTQNVTISSESDADLKFYHTHKSSLVINLTDAVAKTPIEGGTFRLTDAKGEVVEDNLTTDNAGRIVIPGLDAGKYVLTQVKAPEGYVIDKAVTDVTIKDDQTTTVDLTNHKMTTMTIVVLSDKDEYLSGGKFEVRDEDNNIVGEYLMDSTGHLAIESLKPGKYVIKELATPDGWTAKTVTQTVTLSANQGLTVKFYHTQKSNLTVTLRDANSKAFLAGAEYRITKANGDFVADYTTGSNGQFIVDSLDAGKYIVTMTKAPEGYVIDNTPYTVEIKDNKTILLDLTLKAVSTFRLVNTVKQTGAPIGGVTYKVTTYDGTLVDNYTTDDAGLINLDLKPGTYTFYQTFVPAGYVKNDTVWNVTIKAGENQVLEVKNEVESRIVVKFVDQANGNPIMGVKVTIKERDTLDYLGQFTTDPNGEIILTDVLSAGRYLVTLDSCPDMYTKDIVPKVIEVKVGETTELVWKLASHQGQITIVTYAGEQSAMMQVAKNTPVGGAVYVIKDITGKIVATISGDANGMAYSGALPQGTYMVQMTSPPAGFQLNSQVATVVITSQSDNKRVEVFVKAAYYNMTVSVTGQQTGWAGQAMKYAFTNIANNSTTAMTNFYVSIKVPTDAMRGVALYTGTWNGAGTYYNVQYKTNQNDWRTLASGLSSKSNYSYDISSQSLGLGPAEYVTDIRMVFPQVMAGFKNSMAPVLYTQVLSGIRTGYQATVRAEVGGQLAYAGVVNGNENLAGGSWCTGAGQFTSYLYGYVNRLPGQLPTTGY